MSRKEVQAREEDGRTKQGQLQLRGTPAPGRLPRRQKRRTTTGAGSLEGNWLRTEGYPARRYRVGDLIPESWVDLLWRPFTLMNWGYFPADIDEWLDEVIPAYGDDWVELPSMPPVGGAASEGPPDPAAAVGQREDEWPGVGREEESVYYHPEHMLLYFPEAGEVHRLCLNMAGKPPRPRREAGAEETARRLRAPPLGGVQETAPREQPGPAPVLDEGEQPTERTERPLTPRPPTPEPARGEVPRCPTI